MTKTFLQPNTLKLKETIHIISDVFKGDVDSAIQLKLMTDQSFYWEIKGNIKELFNEDETLILNYMFAPCQHITQEHYKIFAFNHLFEVVSVKHTHYALQLLEAAGLDWAGNTKKDAYAKIIHFMQTKRLSHNPSENQPFLDAISSVGHANLPSSVGYFLFDECLLSDLRLFRSQENVERVLQNPDAKMLMECD